MYLAMHPVQIPSELTLPPPYLTYRDAGVSKNRVRSPNSARVEPDADLWPDVRASFSCEDLCILRGTTFTKLSTMSIWINLSMMGNPKLIEFSSNLITFH